MVVRHKNDKKYSGVFFAVAVLLLIEPFQVSAYIDPGTGSFFIQMIIASAVGLSFTMRMFWGNIKRFFTKKSSSSEPTQSEEVYDDKKTP